jgi:uncharacterized protein YPO0396
MSDYPKEKLFRIYAGDIGSDAYKHQYVEWLQQRLAAAEARVKELESRGILNMDEVVNQFYEGE